MFWQCKKGILIQPTYDPSLHSCPACLSNKERFLFKDLRGNNIYVCENCTLQFMNPRYTNRYLEHYYSNYTDNDPENVRRWQEPLLYGHDFYFQFIEKYQAPGKLLDIGCGSGYLIEAAQKRGWQVEGYDVDAQSTQTVAARLNVPVYHGDFLKLDLPPASYDAITLHQVLEHLKTPHEYLKKINSLLKKEGVLFVAVPNVHSLSNRFKYFLEGLGFRRKRRGVYYDSDHHLMYFNTKSLSKLLKARGFEVLFVRNCHSVRPGQSSFARKWARAVTDHLFYKSAFFMIARKKK